MPVKAIMQFRPLFSWVLALAAFLFTLTMPISLPRQVTPVSSTVGDARTDFNRLPIAFELNAGQADASTRFIAHTSGASLAFYQDHLRIGLKAPAQDGADARQDAVTMQFLGAGPAVRVESGSELPGKVNYLLGSDPSQWRTGVPTYEQITYSQIYPGVDLTYSGTGGTLKGTYLLAPGADPGQVRWRYQVRNAECGMRNSGCDARLSVDDAGNLNVALDSAFRIPHSALVESAPIAWQEIGGKRVAVQAGYVTSGDGSVGFAFGAYDKSYPLTIDPVLTYSTYLGGGAYDQGNSIAVDSAGNVYVAGYTQSDNFPVQGAYQGNRHGGIDTFITKLNPSGSALVFSTYLGGNGNDYGQGIAFDSNNNVYVTGYTNSSNFPTANPIQATNRGSNDAFVTKLNSSGSALVYSTYLGGSDDDRAFSIAVDGSGNAHIVGHTPSTDYPTMNPFQATNGGSYDVFVSKVNSSGSALIYSTYLGGTALDYGYGIAADTQDNAYVTGGAYSENFPTVNAYQPNNAMQKDAFLTKINPTGSALVYSTYLGGSLNEEGRAIAIDGTGSAYLTGWTASGDFPLLNPIQSGISRDDVFVTKFNSAGSALVYSTFVVGTYYEAGYGIAVDGPGNAFITGYTTSANFPVVDAIQPNYAGREDAFITKINPAGSAYVFSTYLGGSQYYESIGRDFGYGIAADAQGNAYVTGSTESLDFPTNNAFQPGNGGGYRDAFVAKLANQPSLTATPTRTSSPTITPGGPTLTPTPGCQPNWQYVVAPRERDYNGLSDVDGAAPNDVWAVGGYYNFPGPNPNISLTMHWDGTEWSVIPNTLFGAISAITVIAPDDAWMVGDYANGSDTKTFAAHWDGTSWTRFPTPTRPGLSTLTDVDALASNDVWAVGYNHGFHSTLIEHWNGAYWAIVPSPPVSFSSDYELYGVSAIAPDDIWAVGNVVETGTSQILIEHWDGTEWTIVPSPNPGNYQPHLYGVDAVSANDVWAVGTYSDNFGETYKPLFMHWDGTRWSQVMGETVGTYDQLRRVEARGPNDIWAVGVQADCSLCIFTHTFVMHFDGSEWRHVYSPDGPREVNGLAGVAIISPEDVWAVGTTSDYTTPERYSDALTIHQLCPAGPTPTGTPPTATITPTRTSTPTATACSVGTTNYTITTSTGATVIPATQDVGLHCDDCATTVSLPFPFRLYDMQFNTVRVGSNGTMGFVANNNSWDVTCMPSQNFNYAILPYWQELHLDPTGGGCTGCGIYTLVQGSAPNRVFNIEWRARDYFYTAVVNVEVRLFESAPDGKFEVIYGSVPSGSNQQVTVAVQKEMGLLYTQYVCYNQGATISNGMMITFSQPACGTAGTPTRTATSIASGTPAQATNTATPANATSVASVTTQTATSTPLTTVVPTACAITFSDVPVGDTFYAFIRCLACRGIISGYSDGTFRPGNEITRGQIAKMVSNAAGFSEDVGPQIYEDVPEASPFYAWINRLSMRGHMGGYPCGLVPEETCEPPDNRPYFRPNASATRGQMAKIVSNAAGLEGDPTGLFYTDVAEDHPFYVWIMRLTQVGVMSGYPCGGVGEPCDEESRPYFRPYNNVTRGQASKIVANTFYPGCQTP
ncbi:MAG TPA: SBBP repeat-containing protein [Chloroflexia bacterium]|nr:SBBP repeat-containing protein [Chloroflexia bacterium]